VNGHRVSRSLGKARLMNPYPNVPQDECQGDKEQSHVRIARAGVNPPLSPLAIARFDAEPLAMTFADVGGRAVNPPGSEEKFLTLLFAVFAVR